MASPFVSILVPVYNVEPYIERCARSLFEQTYNNLEYIFVDDCTPDKSMHILEEVIRDYPHRSEQIRIIQHKYNKGLAATRNTLVENAKGDFVMHVDSDDWMELNAVELLVTKQIEIDADVITGQATEHYDDKEREYLTGGWNLGKDDLLEKLLKRKVSTSVWRRIIRRSLYSNNNISCKEGINMLEDFQVFPILVYYSNNIAGIEDVVYHHNRLNMNSYTNKESDDVGLQLQKITSYQIVSDFFKNKHSLYQRWCKESQISETYNFAKEWLYKSKKQYYDIFICLILNEYREHWNAIKINNHLKRMIISNYSLCKICFFLKRLYSSSSII